MSKNKNEKVMNKSVMRIIVLLAGVCAFFALYWTYMSVQEPLYDEGTRKYIFENIGTGFLATYIAISLLVASKNPLYYPFLNKKEKAPINIHAGNNQIINVITANTTPPRL